MRAEHQKAAQSCKGFMPHEEGMALYRAVADVGSKGPIIEVGSYCGKSTIYLGSAALEIGATVFTIDHHRGSEEMQEGWDHHDASLVDSETGRMDSLPELRKNLETVGMESRVVVIVGDASTVSHFWEAPCSLVFIDGGHGPIPAHADFDSWAPKVCTGGLLAIHDVFPDPDDGGRPPYEIYLKALDSQSFVDYAAVGSLRILQKIDL